MPKHSVAAIDLFCGVGGLTRGLIKAGIPVLAGFDIEENCRYAFETNNRSTFIREDIRELAANRLLKIFGKKHYRVLVGCAPCTPFSRHTLKLGQRRRGAKWFLLNSFTNLIEEVKPDVVSMENVPELQKSQVFDKFLKSLRRLGYDVSSSVVFCPDYGIPQNRKRLVVLASRHGEINLLPKTHSPDHYRTVRDQIGMLPVIRDGETHPSDRLHRARLLADVNKRRIRQSKPGGSWLDWDESLLLECHKKATGKTYPSVYGRMHWDEPSPTITTHFTTLGTGRFGHPSQHRALSIREGAMLQTFPKAYKFAAPTEPTNFRALGIQIGNAVPVRLGTIIGRSILKHLDLR